MSDKSIATILHEYLGGPVEAELVEALESHVRETEAEIIELLGARLDWMAKTTTSDNPATTEWAKGFDDGWRGARLQINGAILLPGIQDLVRAFQAGGKR